MVCCKFSAYTNDVEARAKAQKKVTNVNNLVKDIEDILKFIDYINSLDELDLVIWDNRQLDDIPVLNEFKDFILPSAVRYDALNRRTKDLLERDNSENANPISSYADYINICDRFRSVFKKDGYSDVSMIGSLRKSVNLTDVIARASIDSRVAAQGRPFIPVPLVNVGLFEDRYFNETASGIIKDYIADMRFI